MKKVSSKIQLQVDELCRFANISSESMKIDGNNLTVRGSLDLSGTQIKTLPDNLTVRGSLDLSGTQIKTLPDNLTVGGSLYLNGTQIKIPNSLKKPSSNFYRELKLKIEEKFNAKGYTIADGILAKIISTKGLIKKVQIFGQTDISYLVEDGEDNYSHGKTLKEAREDLVYKITAKFDGKLPESTTGKEWIGIYRAITGACSMGVKMFVKQTGKDINDTYTVQEIATLVKEQYGADKFAEKVKEINHEY